MTNEELHNATRNVVDELVELRITRGITQAALARRLGLCRSAIGNFETRDRHAPRLDVVLRYADAVGAELVFVARRSQ